MKYLFLLFLIPLSVMAGDKVGNGGDVVVCEGKPDVLLDLYQAEANWELSLIHRDGTRPEIIRDVLSPLIETDKVIGERLLNRALELETELSKLEKGALQSRLVRFTSAQLVNIADEGVSEIPQNCRILQAATQIQVPFPSEKKFTFQKSIWDQSDRETQSALVLHETIYEFFIERGELASRSTRYFNALLHAEKMNSVEAYLNLAQRSDYKTLAIEIGETRVLKKCAIKRFRRGMGNGVLGEITLVSVQNKPVIQTTDNFLEAMEQLREKFSSRGLCD